MVNDVTALRADPDMAGVVAAAGAAVCLMHMQGTPRTMQDDPRYDDVVAEIVEFLGERVARRSRRGSRASASASIPGSASARPSITTWGCCAGCAPVLGRPRSWCVSRKRFLGMLTGRPASQRVPAYVAAGLFAYRAGAWALRVHDVAETVDALAVERALEEESA